MVEPLFTVRDFRTELSDEVTDPDDDELLRNYEFNISQGIVQRVSRFFDALALSDEPPAHNAGGQSADVAPPPFVMNFGNKRSIGRQETVVWERLQKEGEQAAAAAARKAAEQDTKLLAALEAQVAAAAAREAAEQVAAAAALRAVVQDTEVAALKAQVAAAAAREVAAQVAAAASLKATEQDTKLAALEAQVAEMQALAATSVVLRPIWPTPPSAPSAPSLRTTSAPSSPYTLQC